MSRQNDLVRNIVTICHTLSIEVEGPPDEVRRALGTILATNLHRLAGQVEKADSEELAVLWEQLGDAVLDRTLPQLEQKFESTN